jgi:hypothetical protein
MLGEDRRQRAMQMVIDPERGVRRIIRSDGSAVGGGGVGPTLASSRTDVQRAGTAVDSARAPVKSFAANGG